MPDGTQRAASSFLSGPTSSPSTTVSFGTPGPQTTPSPWLQDGAQTFYDEGGATLPRSVPGGNKGVGSINAEALYVNGVAVGLSGSVVVSLTQGNGIILTPNPIVTTGTVAIDQNFVQILSEKGQTGGYASLDGTGKVPPAQLPSYVDDVVEYANLAAFPATGETGKLYVALDTNKVYRWTGSVYVEVSPAPDLSGYLPLTGGTMTGPLVVNARITAQATTAAPAGGTLGTGYMLGATANFGVMYGTGAANKAAPIGTLYLRGDGTGQPSVNSDGTATGWVPLGGGGSISVGDTPPVSPSPNALWWKSDIGQLFIYYQDPTSTQWVPAAPAPTVGTSPPPGAIMDFAGPTAPAGWLICDGSAVSRVTFATLYGIIGLTYGAGDGTTTFNLPDCRGRVTAGPDGGANRLTSAGFGGTASVGATGGGETQTLSWSQMPNHAHTLGGGAAVLLGNAGTAYGTTVAGGNYVGYVSTMDPSGSSAAHQNVQPTIIFNKIIKT